MLIFKNKQQRIDFLSDLIGPVLFLLSLCLIATIEIAIGLAFHPPITRCDSGQVQKSDKGNSGSDILTEIPVMGSDGRPMVHYGTVRYDPWDGRLYLPGEQSLSGFTNPQW